ncbi:DUF6156 family protein [Nitrogeniibacter aestuarii]|uniref:DUF6156 family protein n=1 Tax=Nitrogeniibacter aestuarii TaxID=2815343 RepID=UPI001E6451E1|nr:DUF6156 family protein [Nitrogeniibacter aestuarii]
MTYDQFYLSYTGVALPLRMVSPIDQAATENRNTWFGVCVDDAGRITLIHKRVYGELELSHRYEYDEAGRLSLAEIVNVDNEGRRLSFDTAGRVLQEVEFDVES